MPLWGVDLVPTLGFCVGDLPGEEEAEDGLNGDRRLRSNGSAIVMVAIRDVGTAPVNASNSG